MRTTYYHIVIMLFAACITSHAQQLQDCTLGIGGKDTETIHKIFQMNEEQKAKMEIWAGEFQIESKLIEDEIKVLFDTHPQGSQEELEKLASKYKVLKDKIFGLSKSYDAKLLSIFNERQYERYVLLCNEAVRRPLVVSPAKVEKDTIPE